MRCTNAGASTGIRHLHTTIADEAANLPPPQTSSWETPQKVSNQEETSCPNYSTFVLSPIMHHKLAADLLSTHRVDDAHVDVHSYLKGESSVFLFGEN